MPREERRGGLRGQGKDRDGAAESEGWSGGQEGGGDRLERHTLKSQLERAREREHTDIIFRSPLHELQLWVR